MATEATRLSEDDTLQALQDRLRERGYDLSPAEPGEFPRVETIEEADARRATRVEHYRSRWLARLPVMYADAALSDLEAGPVREWWTGQSRTLVLAGRVGAGKTHAAYAIGNHVAAVGHWVEGWTVTDLLAGLRPDGPAGLSDDVRRCTLLVLDDLGANKATEWAVEQLTALMDARLREGRRTVITTNAPYDALEAEWGGRLMDRIRHRWTVATFTGESRRRGW